MSITATPSFSHFPITPEDVNNLGQITQNNRLHSYNHSMFKVHLIFHNETDSVINIDIKEMKRLFEQKEFEQIYPLQAKTSLRPNQKAEGSFSLYPIGTYNGKFVFQKETELHIKAESPNCSTCISSILLKCPPKGLEATSFSVALRKDTLPWAKPRVQYISTTLLEKK